MALVAGLAVCLLLTLAGCEEGSEAGGDELNTPVADVAAASRAFQLYHRERVERVIVAFNRFALTGDAGFANTMGTVAVAKQGDEFEIVPGPENNSLIGTSTYTTWHAYRIFRSRTLALSLIRMFDGLAFYEAISGHPGLTVRMAYPGWTRVMDGKAGTVARTRLGAAITPPVAVDAALEAEVLQTFYDGVRITYRENPEDFVFGYMPAAATGQYAVTCSFSELPAFIRVRECCTSLMRTPAPHLWEGAYFGNHNSRDNLPDIGLGLLAAREAMNDEAADDDLRAAARRAFEAGQRIGDLVQQYEGAMMTVDEHHPYDTLAVAGALRPDGETEIEDLGSLSDCATAYLARAVSSQGLAQPLPELPLPGSLEPVMLEEIGDGLECEVPQGVRTCTGLEEAYCGLDWGNLEQLQIYEEDWLELVRALERGSPGMAQQMIGGFQDDYFEKTNAMLGLVHYAHIAGDEALHSRAQAALADMTALMRVFADIIYSATQPVHLTQRLYEAALIDAQGGVAVAEPLDFDDFAFAEQQMATVESWLELEDTASAPLMSDEEIKALVQARLDRTSETAKQRYAEHYGELIPVRRSGEGYEARGVPEEALPWRAVDRPHHRLLEEVRLLDAMPLCVLAPEILDCTWAALGCRRPDLNADGRVDSGDTSLYQAAAAQHADAACGSLNEWCGGADLDRTGAVDEVDAALIEAAQGCWY